ncbi:acetylgalactosaminyl-O-glycosyl-glycoprotein beta-1,3-N-acetylglucosaminyltransferase-like [Hemiscyllium ocellatum]|uniref:acetylgalactosaminyl-O-glycosyl-glycoprotein beta-1,3-N-acetylglucosaminyltransferase-like n=1 Tax=Hemiscyllium ocellatum TaxID=170820 RepID=UPI00296735C3|nr:acetylgalactosaminyl-O-glycosyl-glycoprotein beta-1,3-N-acetylglucosaminyltransferase-like [Hemiscyllium ocellatum]
MRNLVYCVTGLMTMGFVAFHLLASSWLKADVTNKFVKNSIPSPSKVNASKEIYHRQSINLTDGKTTFHMDLNCFQKEYGYMQDYSCKVKISNPKMCTAPENSSLLLIATNSVPSSFTRRGALRKAYAKRQQIKNYQVVTVFMLAVSRSEELMELIAYESRYYGDIIVWDFEEHRANLTLKISCLLQWLNEECTAADFFVKADDDEFVNPEAIVNYVTTDNTSEKVISGHILQRSMVYRFGNNKVSKYLLVNDIYPDFPSGGGYMVPRSFIPELNWKSKTLPAFPVDDVFMGFLALACKIPLRNKKEFYMWGLKYSVQYFKDAFIVHSLSPEKIIEMWEMLQKEKQRLIA